MRSHVEAYVAQQTGLPYPLERSALNDWQLSALNALLRHGRAHSRFYRDYPAALSELRQLSTLPLLDAALVAAAGQSMVCVSQSQIERVVTMATSGTSGPAKRLYYTAADLERTLAFFAVGLREVASSGKRMVVLLPSQRPDSVGDLLLRALPRLGACGVAAPPAASLAEYAALLTQDAAAVVGLPGQLVTLARYLRAQGNPWRPRGALASADWLSPWARAALEAMWGNVLVDHYGSTECALGGALQCAAHGGRHIRESDLLCEIIDPVTGQPVPDGTWGELVITTLRREAMPLIRYRTGDWTRIVPEPCPCGSSLRLLDEVRRMGQHPLWPLVEKMLWPQEAVVDYALRRGADGWLLTILDAGAMDAASVQEALRPYPEAAGLAVQVIPLTEQVSPLIWGKRAIMVR